MGAGLGAGGALLACLLACPLGASVRAALAILLTLAKLDRIPPDALPFVRFTALLVMLWIEIWLYFAF